MKLRIRSYLHVVIQFSAIFYLLYSGSKIAASYWIIIEVTGLIMGLWAIWEMRHSAFSVYPNPEKAARLIVSGPYKLVRHPMYLALFLVLIPLVISYPKMYRILWMIIFTVNQLMKIKYEERVLMKKIPEYRIYMLNSKKLIPFLY